MPKSANEFRKKVASLGMTATIIVSQIPTNVIYANEIDVTDIENIQVTDSQGNILNEEEKIESKPEEEVKNENIEEKIEVKTEEVRNENNIKINSISIENKDIVECGNLKVSMSISIENPEDIQYIGLDFSNGNTYNGFDQINMYYNKNSGLFEGYGPINCHGTWTIKSVNIYRKDSECKSIGREELINDYGISKNDINFNVSKLKINSIDISKKEIYKGIEKSKISMDIEKDENIEYISISYTGIGEIRLYKNNKTGKFEGYIEIDSDSRNSEFTLDRIIIHSKNNEEYGRFLGIGGPYDFGFYEYDINPTDYKIYGKSYVPKSISVDKKQVKPGDIVKIKIDMSNYPGSIPADIGEMRLYYSPSYYTSHYTSAWSTDFVYNNETKLYEGELPISTLMGDGEWNLDKIYIYNKNEVARSILINSPDANINVENNIKEDIIDPITVSVSKTEARPGENIKISVDGVHKDIGQTINLTYRNTTEYTNKHLILRYNGNTKKYEGYFNVSPYMIGDTWTIDHLSLSDNNQQYINIYSEAVEYQDRYIKDFKNTDITIKDATKDTQAPELKSISVDKKQVKPGDKVTISMELTDDKSGIDLDESYVVYSNRNHHYYYNMIENIKYNEESNKYEAIFNIDATMTNGTYEISTLFIKDKSGNILVHNYDDEGMGYYGAYDEVSIDLSGADFKIVDSISSNRELIKSVTIDEKQPQVGDKVNISVELANNSYIDTLDVVYYNKYEDKHETRDVILKYNKTTNRYEGSINIDEDMVEGIWELGSIGILFSTGKGDRIHIGDFTKKEQKEIKELFDIEVVSKITNEISLDTITIDKSKATKGESISLKLTANGVGSEVKKALITYKSEHGTIKLLTINNKNGLFTTNIDIEEYTDTGIWKIDNIILEDSDRNRTKIYNISLDDYKQGVDLSSCNFEVYGTILDKTKPQFIDASIDKNTVVVGEKITVSISAKDLESGIKSVKGTFSRNSYSDYDLNAYKDIDVDFTYNKETDTYDCIIDTELTHQNSGNVSWTKSEDGWHLNNLIIEDNAGNICDYVNWETLRRIDFVVVQDEWHIKEVTSQGNYIEGVTKEYSNVMITIGDKVYKGKSDQYGRFKIEIPKQKGETKINVVVTNNVGTVIQNDIITVIDITGEINKAPEIIANDVELKVGEKFDAKKLAIAKDEEDGDITNKIDVIQNTVDTSKAGVYKVIYKVEDSKGLSTTKEITVNVKEVIKLDENINIERIEDINNFKDKIIELLAKVDEYGRNLYKLPEDKIEKEVLNDGSEIYTIVLQKLEYNDILRALAMEGRVVKEYIIKIKISKAVLDELSGNSEGNNNSQNNVGNNTNNNNTNNNTNSNTNNNNTNSNTNNNSTNNNTNSNINNNSTNNNSNPSTGDSSILGYLGLVGVSLTGLFRKRKNKR